MTDEEVLAMHQKLLDVDEIFRRRKLGEFKRRCCNVAFMSHRGASIANQTEIVLTTDTRPGKDYALRVTVDDKSKVIFQGSDEDDRNTQLFFEGPIADATKERIVCIYHDFVAWVRRQPQAGSA